MCALVQALCGVPREEIIKHYSLSEVRLWFVVVLPVQSKTEKRRDTVKTYSWYQAKKCPCGCIKLYALGGDSKIVIPVPDKTVLC